MGRILIIDDNTHVLEALAAALDSRGHTVETASNRKDAMSLLGLEIDAVLLDIWLGEESGMDVFVEIQKDYPELPVIIMSGGGPGRSLEQAVAMSDALGARSVLIKPFSNQDLYETLAKHGI